MINRYLLTIICGTPCVKSLSSYLYCCLNQLLSECLCVAAFVILISSKYLTPLKFTVFRTLRMAALFTSQVVISGSHALCPIYFYYLI